MHEETPSVDPGLEATLSGSTEEVLRRIVKRNSAIRKAGANAQLHQNYRDFDRVVGETIDEVARVAASRIEGDTAEGATEDVAPVPSDRVAGTQPQT